MSEFQTDEIYGADGSYWNVTTGEQGVTLARGQRSWSTLR